jgi:hypothetical protein
LAFDSKNERHYTAVAARNCLGLETASARANWLEAYERKTSQAADVSLCLLSYENLKQNYAYHDESPVSKNRDRLFMTPMP